LNLDTSKILRLEQVSLYTKLKTQQGYPILQDISFEVSKGDRLAIVGASGAGKTFLLRLLNRLSEPSSGKIYLENQEYHQIPVLQLRQQVVLVAQECKLLGMNVKDALAYGLVLRNFSKQEIQQRLTYWLEELRIPEEWLTKTELQLSTGERQWVAIARALIIQPKILLLDEPTTTLDERHCEYLIQVLTQINQNYQTTILMVNHQLKLVQFCNRVLHLDKGRLFINQPSSEIKWGELQQNLIQAQDDFGF